MNLETERYSNQLLRWPKESRHIFKTRSFDKINTIYRIELIDLDGSSGIGAGDRRRQL
jgi:hypothetical protein